MSEVIYPVKYGMVVTVPHKGGFRRLLFRDPSRVVSIRTVQLKSDDDWMGTMRMDYKIREVQHNDPQLVAYAGWEERDPGPPDGCRAFRTVLSYPENFVGEDWRA